MATLLVFGTVNVNGTCWPTALIAVVLVAFTRLRPPVSVAGTVAVDGFESTGAGFGSVGVPGGVPCAVAVSVTDPLSRSACVTVYVPVQVSDAPAANVLDGQVTPDIEAATEGALCTSVTFTPVMATLLVFVTVNVNVTCWPTVLIAVVVLAFTSVRPPVTVVGTVAVDGFESTGAGVGSVGVAGGVPCAVAVSDTLPLSRSAWVTVYFAVQVSDAPAANDELGQEIVNIPAATDGALCTSVTFTPVMATLLVFVTVNVNGTS